MVGKAKAESTDPLCWCEEQHYTAKYVQNFPFSPQVMTLLAFAARLSR
jgi:hypothetical protein